MVNNYINYNINCTNILLPPAEIFLLHPIFIVIFSFLSRTRENPAMTDWTHQSPGVFVVVTPFSFLSCQGTLPVKKIINSKYDFFSSSENLEFT